MRQFVKWILLPLMLMLASERESRAQSGGVGIGIGVGTGFPGFGPGYGYGPYWGPGWGRGFGYPGWYPGVFPGQMYGNYSNGLSMYGPPVPTYKPIPGVFGGGDSRFFPPPPAYMPGYYNFAWLPIHQTKPILPPGYVQKDPVVLTPAPLPASVAQGDGSPPNLGVLTDSAPFELEIHVPKADAQVFINGQNSPGAGAVRTFKSSPVDAVESHTMEVKAVWTTAEGKVSHTKRVTSHPGERTKVVFKD